MTQNQGNFSRENQPGGSPMGSTGTSSPFESAGTEGKKATERLNEAAEQAREKAGEMADQARSAASQASHKVSQAASQVGERVSEATQRLRETDLSETAESVKSYARQHPAQALVIAAGVGFALGMLMRPGR